MSATSHGRAIFIALSLCVCLVSIEAPAAAAAPLQASAGDITAVSAGTGLAGGGKSGAVSLSIRPSYRLPQGCPPQRIARFVAGAWRCSGDSKGSDWHVGGNAGTTPGKNFLGTRDNQRLVFKVNGRRALLLQPASTPNIVGGFSGNVVKPGVVGATIAGGGAANQSNAVTDAFGAVGGGAFNNAGDVGGTTTNAAFATVGGGFQNQAAAPFATVGGGHGNGAATAATIGGGSSNVALGGASTIAGGESNEALAGDAVVAGGDGNQATGLAAFEGAGISNTADNSYDAVAGGIGNHSDGPKASIGGGSSNTASGEASVVDGGSQNSASGSGSVVAGGFGNVASGTESMAAGTNAHAIHTGSFVWGDDSANSQTTDNQANAFVARAAGGVHFYTAAGSSTSAGAVLPAGSGSWVNISDRHVKTGIHHVSGRSVLQRLRHLRVDTWRYRAQRPGIRHMGPMAQSFRRVFGLGESRRYIADVDAQGVALAAIKGADERISRLRTRLGAQSARIGALEREVRKLARRR